MRKLLARTSSPIAWRCVHFMPVLLLAAGCAHHDAELPAGTGPVAQTEAAAPASTRAPSPRDRLNAAVELLKKGEEAAAETELKACLAQAPDSRSAKLLLSEIETPVSDLYPKENFTVTLGKNETLSALAATWLGDPLAFYGLARYNGIANPARIAVGTRIRIPKTAAALAAQAGRNNTSDASAVAALANPDSRAAKTEANPPALRVSQLDAAKGSVE